MEDAAYYVYHFMVSLIRKFVFKYPNSILDAVMSPNR